MQENSLLNSRLCKCGVIVDKDEDDEDDEDDEEDEGNEGNEGNEEEDDDVDNDDIVIVIRQRVVNKVRH